MTIIKEKPPNPDEQIFFTSDFLKYRQTRYIKAPEEKQEKKK